MSAGENERPWVGTWALWGALFAIALVAFTPAALFIVERLGPWLSDSPNAPAWAQATGSFITVLLIGTVALAESRRSRQILEAQAELKKLEFDHQINLEVAALDRNKRAAVSNILAAHELLIRLCRFMHKASEPLAAGIYEFWQSDMELAQNMVLGVKYEHFHTPDDMKDVGRIQSRVIDFCNSIKYASIAEVDSKEFDHFYRGAMKDWMHKIEDCIVRLDGDFVPTARVKFPLSTEEEGAFRGLTQ